MQREEMAKCEVQGRAGATSEIFSESESWGEREKQSHHGCDETRRQLQEVRRAVVVVDLQL